MSKEQVITVESVKVETTPEEVEKMMSTSSTQDQPVTVAPEVKQPNVTLSDLLEKVDEELKTKEGTPTKEEETKSKKFLEGFTRFIQGEEFDSKCEDMSIKHNIPKKQIATNFIGKALGTVSDLLHIAIGGIEAVATSLVKLISSVLLSGVNIICNVARSLARLLTFNQTAKA